MDFSRIDGVDVFPEEDEPETSTRTDPIDDTTPNRTLLWAFFLLLPIQFMLLRFGTPHGTTDAIGVLLTIASCPLLAMAFYPQSGPKVGESAEAGQALFRLLSVQVDRTQRLSDRLCRRRTLQRPPSRRLFRRGRFNGRRHDVSVGDGRSNGRRHSLSTDKWVSEYAGRLRPGLSQAIPDERRVRLPALGPALSRLDDPEPLRGLAGDRAISVETEVGRGPDTSRPPLGSSV